MTHKTCPKCHHKSDDLINCASCGLNFEEYEVEKQEKLLEIHTLISEGRYADAREIAEELPGLFPDNKTDFVLLLSNINRDISIVQKKEQAHAAYANGDFEQASFLLRNIKAFNPALNEQVISLRRKAERQLRNREAFAEGVAAFNDNQFGTARKLFRQVRGFQNQSEVDEYLVKIETAVRTILEKAVGYIRNRQYNLAEEKLRRLRDAYPDLGEEIDRYLELLDGRREIKNSIMAAARQAEQEKRFLESKVLYTFLETQFPEFSPLIRPRLDKIGPQAITSLADLARQSPLDESDLGLDQNSAALSGGKAEAEDTNRLVPVHAGQPAGPDEFCPPVTIDVEGVDDFIF